MFLGFTDMLKNVFPTVTVKGLNSGTSKKKLSWGRKGGLLQKVNVTAILKALSMFISLWSMPLGCEKTACVQDSSSLLLYLSPNHTHTNYIPLL